MTKKLVNYREAITRFSHIDATFVAAEIGPDLATCRYVVRLYPWWEHPLYLQARDAGAPWGFVLEDEATRDVAVVARDPVAFHLSRRESVTDWAFCESHPLLWPFEDAAELFCNSDVDRLELIEAILRRNIPHLTRARLSEYIAPVSPHRAPFSLGYFPRSLFLVAREELERMGVRLFIAREPREQERLVLFLIDGEDYIVAHDFDIEVPDFEHRPEWFQPR